MYSDIFEGSVPELQREPETVTVPKYLHEE
jgi:hypothetical protein